MRDRCMPLMECRPIFHSRDADATQAFIRSVGFDIDVAGRDHGTQDTRINGVYLCDSYLGYIQYGAATQVRTTPMRTDYWLQLPLRGCTEIHAGRSIIDCDTRTAVVGSPVREHILTAGAGSARVQVSITGPALLRHLTALLGEAPCAPLEMGLSIDLRSGCGQRLCHYLNLALADFETSHGCQWSVAAMREFEQVLMTLLLLEHRHNYSQMLSRLAQPIAPHGVKRAIDFMHANLAAPMSLSDIVAAAGVPGRTLFEHFRVFKGISPMRYLRDARLAEVRRALMRAKPGVSITEIATNWGFSHLGRFALDYRRRFGETPRATLAAARCGLDLKAAPTDRAAYWRGIGQLNAGATPSSIDPSYDRSG